MGDTEAMRRGPIAAFRMPEQARRRYDSGSPVAYWSMSAATIACTRWSVVALTTPRRP